MDQIHRSRWNFEVPQVSFPTYIFKSVFEPLPNKPLFVDAAKPESIFLTLDSFRLWSKRLAVGLQKAGLSPGDRCLFISTNTVFFPVVLMGVVMAGGIFTAANPSYTARELAYQIKDSDPAFIIAAEATLDTVLQAAKERNFDWEKIFTIGTADEILREVKPRQERQVRSLGEILGSIDDARSFSWKTVLPDNDCDRVLALNYSSGTTGLPKGVQITHRNYVANTAALLYVAQQDPHYRATNSVSRQLLYLPLYHAMAQTMCFVTILRDSIVYVMPRFDMLQALENVQKFRITELNLAPPIVVAMVKDPRVRKFDLSSVRRALSGAAPLSGDMCNEFEGIWPSGHVKIQQGWGMTEATSLITTWDPSEQANPSSVGELGPNLEAKVVVLDTFSKEYGRPVGELLVRGPNITKGYWKKEQDTRDTILPGGWLKTGDVGYFEKEKVFIVDRLKELIKVKGFQVAPAELEALLLGHTDVVDAAVVGVKIDGEEAPRAYVVPRASASVSASGIQAFVDENVVHYKRLTGGVFFVEAIPKNPSGKILRSVIRSWDIHTKNAAQKFRSNI